MQYPYLADKKEAKAQQDDGNAKANIVAILEV